MSKYNLLRRQLLGRQQWFRDNPGHEDREQRLADFKGKVLKVLDALLHERIASEDKRDREQIQLILRLFNGTLTGIKPQKKDKK